MGREIYDIINDMAEVLNASQMQKLQEVLVKRLSENTVSDYLQTTNMDFLDMFLTAKHLEGCSDKTICYYRCNIEKMLDTINIRRSLSTFFFVARGRGLYYKKPNEKNS